MGHDGSPLSGSIGHDRQARGPGFDGSKCRTGTENRTNDIYVNIYEFFSLNSADVPDGGGIAGNAE
jgi:hypothetical protein